VVNIKREMKIVRIIGNIIFQILLLTFKCLERVMCSCRFLSGHFQCRMTGNIPIKHFFPFIMEQDTGKYSQINLKFKGLIRVVRNLYSSTCIVLPSDGGKNELCTVIPVPESVVL